MEKNELKRRNRETFFISTRIARTKEACRRAGIRGAIKQIAMEAPFGAVGILETGGDIEPERRYPNPKQGPEQPGAEP